MCDSKDPELQFGTFFAPVERASADTVRRQIEVLGKNPLVDNLLETVSGLLAVLNEQRQILIVNDLLMGILGIDREDLLLGLRPGEAIHCIYAREEAGGCGTSRFCSTCGAACAIVKCLNTNTPTERECAITVRKDGKQMDLYFYVRCSPLVIDGQRFVMLFLRDISVEQQRAALERIFYHDVSNVIENLLFNSRLLNSQQQGEDPGPVAQILELSSRLADEVRIQRALARGPEHYALTVHEISLKRFVLNLVQVLDRHPAARGRVLRLMREPPDVSVTVDRSLLNRILTNMLTNALEATDDGGEVRFWVETDADAVTFCVWNQGVIRPEVARRVFQRNFSTKKGDGRGLGAYAMRLLGETYLHGKVDFATSPTEGTLFHFRLPKQREAGQHDTVKEGS